MHTLVAVALLAAILIAFLGWGLVLERLVRSPAYGWPITAGAGMAVFLFLGGLASLLRIAYGGVLWALVLAGIAFAVARWRSLLAWVRSRSWARYDLMIAAVIVTVILVHVVTTQLPPRAFNYDDDFKKYLVHPVRMLQTGTLFGAPCSALGSETLGGQALLQGLIASILPLSYVNGVDAVLGLALTLALATGPVGFRPNIWQLVAGPVVAFAVDPQVVNISSVYTGSALMIAALRISFAPGDTESRAPCFVLGLLYAGLLALKPTHALFVASHFVLLSVAWLLRSPTIKTALLLIGRTATGLALALAPWVLVHLPHYLAAGRATASPAVFPEAPILWSFIRNEHGFSQGQYLLLCVLPAATAVAIGVSRIRARPGGPGGPAPFLLEAAVSLTSYFFGFLLLAPHLNGYQHSLRYVIPVLLATSVVVITRALSLPTVEARAKVWHRLALVVAVSIVSLFSPSLMGRVRQATENGTSLAFSRQWPAEDNSYLSQFADWSLGMENAKRMAIIQDKVPKGARIVAWTGSSYWLDFNRNQIFDADSAGLANPWSQVPEQAYYVFEYRGPAVHPIDYYRASMQAPLGSHEYAIAKKTVDFLELTERLGREAEVIYKDETIVAFRPRLAGAP